MSLVLSEHNDSTFINKKVKKFIVKLCGIAKIVKSVCTFMCSAYTI